MTRPRFIVCVAWLALAVGAGGVRASAATPASNDVVMLVVSESQSYDPMLPILKYADRDGSRFADIMVSVGRVPLTHIVRLKDATSEELPLAVERVNKLLAECGPGCAGKFIFYYSGHADESGLHFRDGRLGKEQLHAALAAVKAPTKIVLLDSRFAGAMAQKGVQTAPTFELPKAEFDEPSGSIYISASSGREYSYESDELRGSVFTYHLIAGLAGEADLRGDGVVTVDELYQYVYRETKLHSLMFPSAASQTPEFVSRLAGRGAIALSFPKETNAHLLLGGDIGGQITIASLGGIQTFHVDKPLGVRKTLQLPSGRYAVSVSQGYRTGQTQLQLEPKRLAMLAGSDLAWKDHSEPLTKKGPDAAGGALTLGVSAGRHGGYSGNEGAGAALALSVTTEGSGDPGSAARLRWTGSLGTESYLATESQDWATTNVYGMKLGPVLEVRNPWTRLSETLLLTLDASAAYQQQDWHYAERGPRSFRSVMPGAGFGAAYAVKWPQMPGRWLIEARRDFVGATDVRTGRRNLAANYFGLGIQF